MKDYISDYVCQYLVNSRDIVESTVRKCARYSFQAGALVLGAVAGTPYIQVGFKAAKDIFGSASPMGDLVAIGVVVSFGATTMWAFFEVSEFLDPQPAEIGLIKSTVSKLRYYTEHLTCHFFGVIGAIPAYYISSKYNTAVWPVFVACGVQYAFCTLGNYKLKDMLIVPLLHRYQKITPNNIKQNLVGAINQYLIPRYQQVTSKQLIKRSASHDQNEPNSAKANRAFLGMVLDAKNQHKVEKVKNCPNRIRRWYVWPIYAIYPQLNIIYVSAIVYNALYAIHPTTGFALGFTPFIAMPLYGLDIFTAKSVVDLIDAKIGRNCGIKKTSSYVKTNHPRLNFLIPVAGLTLSLFSAVTDGYVAYKEVVTSDYSSAGVVFAVSVWASKVILQTIGFSYMGYKVVETADAWFDQSVRKHFRRIKNTQKFAALLASSRDEVFNKYHAAYDQVITKISENRPNY